MENINKKKQISITAMIAIITVLVAAVAGTVLYYNQLINDKNSQIASLTAQIESLDDQVTNLNLPNLVTGLGIGVQNDANISINGVHMTGDVLYISGSITNQGKTTAYDVKLNVVATNIYGSTIVNMTVPLWGNFVVGEDPSLISNTGSSISIDPIQTMNYVNIKILCQDAPATWSVTPVYTTAP